MKALRILLLSLILLIPIACQKSNEQSVHIPPPPSRSYSSEELRVFLNTNGFAEYNFEIGRAHV